MVLLCLFLRSALIKHQVYELRFAEVDCSYKDKLHELLDVMNGLVAFYLATEAFYGDGDDIYDFFHSIVDKYKKLQHFQLGAGVRDDTGELDYLMVNRPSETFVNGNIRRFGEHVNITKIELQILDALEIIPFDEFISDDYANLSLRSIEIGVHPNSRRPDNVIYIFFKRCVSHWSELEKISAISLFHSAYTVEITKPIAVGADKEADKNVDKNADKEIRVTIRNASYNKAAWLSWPGYYFTIIFAPDFPPYFGAEPPSYFARHGYRNELGPLLSMRTIRTMVFLRPDHYMRSLNLIADEENLNSFKDVVILSGLVGDELNISKIPFVKLQKLRSLQYIHFQTTASAMMIRWNVDVLEGFEPTDVAKCHAALGAHVAIEANGVCFSKVNQNAYLHFNCIFLMPMKYFILDSQTPHFYIKSAPSTIEDTITTRDTFAVAELHTRFLAMIRGEKGADDTQSKRIAAVIYPRRDGIYICYEGQQVKKMDKEDWRTFNENTEVEYPIEFDENGDVPESIIFTYKLTPLLERCPELYFRGATKDGMQKMFGELMPYVCKGYSCK